MTSDIRLAFAHPEERSVASASADPRDRISLRDHVVEVEIGAFQKERGHTQRVMFNVVIEVRPAPAPLDDDVDKILSYDRITEAIATELAAERLNLLETLAERVAERILAEPQAMRAFVRIEKLDIGPYKLGVEIVRSRAEAALKVLGQDGQEAALHPLVVYLDNAAIHADDLSSRLDALQAAILVEKLPCLDQWNQQRRDIARRYSEQITNPLVRLPQVTGESALMRVPSNCGSKAMSRMMMATRALRKCRRNAMQTSATTMLSSMSFSSSVLTARSMRAVRS